jgi:hypothetical protein
MAHNKSQQDLASMDQEIRQDQNPQSEDYKQQDDDVEDMDTVNERMGTDDEVDYPEMESIPDSR